MAHLKKAASGHLLKGASGHLVNDCVPGVPSSCPCDAAEWLALLNDGTECHNLVDCYRIRNYVDGDLPSCPTCTDPFPGNPIWDGSFPVMVNQRCIWGKPSFSGVDEKRIDGKDLYGAALVFSGGPNRWIVVITCGEFPRTVWEGEKLTGSTPVGVYNLTDSYCQTTHPGTLYIEECP